MITYIDPEARYSDATIHNGIIYLGGPHLGRLDSARTRARPRLRSSEIGAPRLESGNQADGRTEKHNLTDDEKAPSGAFSFMMRVVSSHKPKK